MSKSQITLYSDAKASHDRFAITNVNGDVVWYGKFFDTDKDYNGEQWTAERSAAKKAVWLAAQVKQALNLEHLKLILYIDAQWLTYQDHPKQKGYVLTWLAKKYNIELEVLWIRGTSNPADAWTTESGYKNWRDTFEELKKTVEPIIDEPPTDNDDLSSEFLGEKVIHIPTENERKVRGKYTDDFSKLQFSEIDSSYYLRLVKKAWGFTDQNYDKYSSSLKGYKFDQKEIADWLKNKKSIDIVFGKWISETEKLFWLHTIKFCIENTKLNEYLNTKKRLNLSIGAAGKKHLGYFSVEKKALQLNHLRRKDKTKLFIEKNGLNIDKDIFRIYHSGIVAIFHEFSHYIDYLNNWELSKKYDNENLVKEFIKKIKIEYKNEIGLIKRLMTNKGYLFDSKEIFARINEMNLKMELIKNLNLDFDLIELKDKRYVAINEKLLVGSIWDAGISDFQLYFKKIIYLDTYEFFEK